nr:ribonuclease H-like domain-containing protein [Tanacetum cinerariifolium]
MHDEYNALVKNGTWILVPRPAGINLVRSIWLFKHKFHVDGTLSHYKARLVANGSSQQLGIDYDETFSLVVKPATICIVLSLVVSRKCAIHQLDVKNAFVNRDLSETVYLHQPPGFVDPRDLRLLIYLSMWKTLFLQLCLHTYYRLFLSQKQHAIELLARAHMTNCNPSRTPVDTDSKLGLEGVPVQDPTLYHSLAGGLQYLKFTRPDISYAVQQICLYMHDPRKPHLAALKRLLRYIRGTMDFRFHLYSSTTISLVGLSLALVLRLYTGATYPVKHQRTKHIEIDIHFVRDLVTAGQVRVLHMPSRYQYADIFTKGLPSALFENFRSSLSVHLPLAQTAVAY